MVHVDEGRTSKHDGLEEDQAYSAKNTASTFHNHDKVVKFQQRHERVNKFDVGMEQFISKTDRRNRERSFLFQEGNLIWSNARGERLDKVR